MPIEGGKQISWLEWAGRHGRDVITLVTIVGLLFAGAIFVLKDNTRVQEGIAGMAGVTELREEVSALRRAIEANTNQLAQFNQDSLERAKQAGLERDELIRRMDALDKTIAIDQDNSPPVRFVESGSVIQPILPASAIRLGDRVRITWRIIKVRDCGSPVVQNLVMDSGGVQVQLEDVSNLDVSGRAVGSPVDPATVRDRTYTARIPEDKGLVPGQAKLWLRIRYDDAVCPNVGPLESPAIPFELQEAG